MKNYTHLYRDHNKLLGFGNGIDVQLDQFLDIFRLLDHLLGT